MSKAAPIDIDPDRIADILRAAAAEEILPRFQTLKSHEISEKNPGDLVTVADQASEAFLTRELSAITPGALIVGEEAHEEDASALGQLAEADWAWIIDPVDGTHNFAHGVPRFAVIVALAHKGETVQGWILDPVNDDLATVQRGAGAFLNGNRMHLGPTPPITAMTGSLGRRQADRLRHQSGEIPKDFTRYRCVGLEYMDLAGGALDFARYGGKLMPWDHAAGVLMFDEAGGFAAITQDARNYRPGDKRAGDVLLLAPDRPSWDRLKIIMP